MSQVIETVDVNVPIGTAYDQWTQFESFPEFMQGVESVEQLDNLHTHWVTEVEGVRREFDAEITEQHPDERIAWKSIDGDVDHAGVVTFHRLGDQETRVTVQLDWRPKGFVEKVGSALGLDKHQVKTDTGRFKEFIEHRGTASGAYRGDQPAPGAETFTVPTPTLTPVRDAADSAMSAAPATQPEQRDVVDVLLAQHAEIKEAFARLQEATGRSREGLFTQLAGLLHRHETGEQQVVHPAIRNDSVDGEGIALARLSEEHLADEAVAALERLGVGHDDFDRELEALHQAVLAHAAHEEDEEFPQLRKLSVERRARLADELLAAQAAEG